MNIWFISDTHFGHGASERNPNGGIINYCNRPFSSVEEMNEVMIERWNSRVKPEDTIIHLGDFALGKKDLWPSYASRLNGYKILVCGNHDLVDKTPLKTLERFHALGFSGVFPEEYYLSYGNRRIWCAHIPKDNEDDRREYRRPPAQYHDIALAGHVHDKWKIGKYGEINVGVDVWDFYPVHIEEILTLVP